MLKTLLDKLEAIRAELRSDKVFDVVGRLFENVSLKDYLEQAATEEGTKSAIDGIDGLLTAEQVRALHERNGRCSEAATSRVACPRCRPPSTGNGTADCCPATSGGS